MVVIPKKNWTLVWLHLPNALYLRCNQILWTARTSIIDFVGLSNPMQWTKLPFKNCIIALGFSMYPSMFQDGFNFGADKLKMRALHTVPMEHGEAVLAYRVKLIVLIWSFFCFGRHFVFVSFLQIFCIFAFMYVLHFRFRMFLIQISLSYLLVKFFTKIFVGPYKPSDFSVGTCMYTLSIL